MLEINQQAALIGIKTTPGVQSIYQPHAEQEIRQIPTKVEIERELPRVLIDQYQCFAEEGLKNYRDLTREMAQLAQQNALQYTARQAQEGDTLMRLEDGGSPIPEIAVQNAWPEFDYNIGIVPQSRPQISSTGSLKFNVTPGSVEINVTPHRPEINYTPGKVEIYLRQQPSLSIRYIGENVDMHV